MVGALFIYPMFQAARLGLKTQTRRLGEKPTWKVGQTLYVKEPLYLLGTAGENPPPGRVIYERGGLKFTRAQYVWDNSLYPSEPDVFWRSQRKLFCPEKAARFEIKIQSVKQQLLGCMTADDYLAEGLQEHYAIALDDRSRSKKEWRVEMANDLMFSDSDPAKVYAYLLKATAGKDVYNPDTAVWAYEFTWHEIQK